MSMLWLRIDAPFAACRTFTAGWYRPTAGFLTHSAVYGLLLNVAGVESRLWEHESDHRKHDPAGPRGYTPASLTKCHLPQMKLALGVPAQGAPPRVQTVYQQLHNYPQDTTKIPDPENPGKKIAKPVEGFRRAKGSKYNITPVRREVLCDIQALAAVEADEDFIAALRRGLRGEHDGSRYGLPFLGDNSFLLDRLEEVEPQPARWYERIEGEHGKPREGTTRLTIHVDRADMSQTKAALFAPTDEPAGTPPDSSWVEAGPPSNS